MRKKCFLVQSIRIEYSAFFIFPKKGCMLYGKEKMWHGRA